MLPLWALKQELSLKLLHDSCGFGPMVKRSSGSLTEAGGAVWVAGKGAVCDQPSPGSLPRRGDREQENLARDGNAATKAAAGIAIFLMHRRTAPIAFRPIRTTTVS